MIEGIRNWFSKILFGKLSVSMQKKETVVKTSLYLTFLMALIGLIAIIFAFVDIHVWSKDTGRVILVPRDKIITINGQQYLPIRLTEL